MLAIAFTGGPGFGKSATIAALEARGHRCVPESARAIIQERVRDGLAKRPPAPEFAAQILARDQAQYKSVKDAHGPVFFDRSLIDALGMCSEAGLPCVARIAQILDEYRFHRTAFVFPPWPEIYATDSERDQTLEEAVAVDHALRKWYLLCGFDLVDVPRTDVEARCEFILSQLPAT